MTTLEKMRAEIEQLENPCSKEHGCIAEVLQVVDKYAEQEPCDDVVSREDALKLIYDFKEKHTEDREKHPINYGTLLDLIRLIRQLPSVRPQEPKTGHCKECKYFEYDSVAKVDGVPLIVAHEICNKWGDGCKTKEDGYCFMFEPQESEDKE